MSRRTYSYNAFEAQLATALSAGATSVTLSTTTGLRYPGRLVLEPDTPAKREYIQFEGITGNTLDNVTRGLDGSTSGAQAHDIGALVQTMTSHQFQDDVFADIEDLETADTAHEANSGDPHSAAGYMSQSEGDLRYVNTSGDTMTGHLGLPSGPTDTQAVRKDYVDSEIAASAQTVWAWGQDGINPVPTSVTDVGDFDLTIPSDWTTFDIFGVIQWTYARSGSTPTIESAIMSAEIRDSTDADITGLGSAFTGRDLDTRIATGTSGSINQTYAQSLRTSTPLNVSSLEPDRIARIALFTYCADGPVANAEAVYVGWAVAVKQT
jgi:hypothetical protein